MAMDLICSKPIGKSILDIMVTNLQVPVEKGNLWESLISTNESTQKLVIPIPDWGK
jgi:hypothetical protein